MCWTNTTTKYTNIGYNSNLVYCRTFSIGQEEENV